MSSPRTPRAQKIFTRRVSDGHLMAVRNWRHRLTTDDAIIAVPLSDTQLRRYKIDKKAGLADEAIFNDLFPPPDRDKIALSIDELTKTQLISLIERVQQVELPTLQRMSCSDLALLLRSLAKQKSQTQAWLI
ncbi:MAG: hypothetical protein AB8B96_11255 [Lysobacterales bacterium]